MARIYETLLAEVTNDTVESVILGVNWTLVQSSKGCGLAQTPRRDAPGCQPIADAGQLTSQNLKQLAELVRSENPMEISIGMAAINAHYNHYDLRGPDLNGLDAFADIEGRIAVIGRFPRLEKHLKNYCVFEREPREGEYAEKDMGEILSDCPAVIITAATLANGTAAGIIELAGKARKALVGPGTPLAPGLEKLGIESLAGMVVHNAVRARKVVAEGGAVAALKTCGRYVTLKFKPSV
ncbi:MAG: hypothetical protein HQ503_07965 [Rhodospirillales bacterium]|nr:hypothetical protein [Rhodospirillales bacterium]